MPRISRRAAPWRILVLASVGLGCGVKSDSEGTGFGSEAADTGSGAGEPGAPCQVDTDCVGGGGCLPPSFFPDGDRVCGPPCMVVEDCAELAAADYAFEVGLASPGPDGNNLWNSSVLSRGRACDAGHCQFLCPEYGAVVYGDDDVAAGFDKGEGFGLMGIEFADAAFDEGLGEFGGDGFRDGGDDRILGELVLNRTDRGVFGLHPLLKTNHRPVEARRAAEGGGGIRKA